jgi:hypothetical protein
MDIRPYRPGDEEQIMALDQRELFSPWNRRDITNWHWKFGPGNPAGPARIWLAQDADGRVVAHFAAVCYRLQVGGSEVVGSHTIGALVDKKYQNRGLLKIVGDKLFADLDAGGMPFTYGFPNRRAHEFEKMAFAYRDLLKFDTWTLPGTRLRGVDFAPGFAPVTTFTGLADRLWDACRADYPVAVVRRQEYLNWRYCARPDWRYFPFALEGEGGWRGYVVLKLYREEQMLRGHIVDIFARRADADAFRALVAGSLAFFARQHVSEVTVWVNSQGTVEQALQHHGFALQPAGVPLILRVPAAAPVPALIADAANWFFTMGDSTEIF